MPPVKLKHVAGVLDIRVHACEEVYVAQVNIFYFTTF